MQKRGKCHQAFPSFFVVYFAKNVDPFAKRFLGRKIYRVGAKILTLSLDMGLKWHYIKSVKKLALCVTRTVEARTVHKI